MYNAKNFRAKLLSCLKGSDKAYAYATRCKRVALQSSRTRELELYILPQSIVKTNRGAQALPWPVTASVHHADAGHLLTKQRGVQWPAGHKVGIHKSKMWRTPPSTSLMEKTGQPNHRITRFALLTCRAGRLMRIVVRTPPCTCVICESAVLLNRSPSPCEELLSKMPAFLDLGRHGLRKGHWIIN